jgi:hypothetical protein
MKLAYLALLSRIGARCSKFSNRHGRQLTRERNFHMESLRSRCLSTAMLGLGLWILIFMAPAAFASDYYKCIYAIEIMSHTEKNVSFKILDSIEVSDRSSGRCEARVNTNLTASLAGKETEVGKTYEVDFSFSFDPGNAELVEKWEVIGAMTRSEFKFLSCRDTQESPSTVHIELFKHANNEISVAITAEQFPRYYFPATMVKESFSQDTESFKISGNVGRLAGYVQILDSWTQTGPVTYQYGGTTKTWEVACVKDSPREDRRIQRFIGCYDATGQLDAEQPSQLSDSDKICVGYTPNNRSGNYSFEFYNNGCLLNTIGADLTASTLRCPNCYTFEGMNTKVSIDGDIQGINFISVEYAGFKNSFKVEKLDTSPNARDEDNTTEVNLVGDDLIWANSLIDKYDLKLSDCQVLETKIGYLGSSATNQKQWSISAKDFPRTTLKQDDIEFATRLFRVLEVQVARGGGYIHQNALFRIYRCGNDHSVHVRYHKRNP